MSALVLEGYGTLNYCCPICKADPPIVILDGNAKTIFDIDERVGEEGLDGYDGRVDFCQFWDKMAEDVVGRSVTGLVEGDVPRFNFWSPMVDPHSRADRAVNTEYQKLNALQDLRESGTRDLSTITDEDIAKVANAQSVTREELVRLCNESHIPIRDAMSKMDLLKLLKDAAVRDAETDGSLSIRKYFTRIFGTNGGLITALCPHGIVYGFKILLRGEGQRDVLDLLLSFRQLPKVIIYDHSGGLARHAKKRMGDTFLGPWDGCVFSPTDEAAAAEASAAIAAHRFLYENVDEHPQAQYPLILTDKFHELNGGRRQVLLPRSTRLIRELDDVNSQVCESFNSILKRSLYYRTQMNWRTQIIELLLSISDYNKRLCQEINESIRRRVPDPVNSRRRPE